MRCRAWQRSRGVNRETSHAVLARSFRIACSMWSDVSARPAADLSRLGHGGASRRPARAPSPTLVS